MNYRYHPIVEGLKVNEDGTSVIYNGTELEIKSYHPKTQRKEIKYCYIPGKYKTVTLIKLILEAWHGVAPSAEHAARRVDEFAGDNYKNLQWGKKGMTISSVKGSKSIENQRKMSKEVFNKIEELLKTMTLGEALKAFKIESYQTYYKFRDKHVKNPQ